MKKLYILAISATLTVGGVGAGTTLWLFGYHQGVIDTINNRKAFTPANPAPLPNAGPFMLEKEKEADDSK